MIKWTNDFISKKPTWTIKELAPHAMRICPQRWKGNESSCRSQLAQNAKRLGCRDINGYATNFTFNQADSKKLMDECLEWQNIYLGQEKEREQAAKEARAEASKSKTQPEQLPIPNVFDLNIYIGELRSYVEALEQRIITLEEKVGE